MFIGIELKINWQFSVYIKVFLNHPASRLKFLWFRMHNNTNAYQYTKPSQPPSHRQKIIRKTAWKKLFINTFILLFFLFGCSTYIHISVSPQRFSFVSTNISKKKHTQNLYTSSGKVRHVIMAWRCLQWKKRWPPQRRLDNDDGNYPWKRRSKLNEKPRRDKVKYS